MREWKKYRRRRKRRMLPELSAQQILAWADAHFQRTWSSPRKVDTKLRVFGLFVLRWGNVPQRRVTTLVVVEDLDVFDERRPRLGTRGEVGVVDQLLLQRGEEAFHRRVVPAVGLAAHAARDAVLGQEELVVLAGVLAAPIRVRQQPRAGQTPLHGQLQSIDHEAAL